MKFKPIEDTEIVDNLFIFLLWLYLLQMFSHISQIAAAHSDKDNGKFSEFSFCFCFLLVSVEFFILATYALCKLCEICIHTCHSELRKSDICSEII